MSSHRIYGHIPNIPVGKVFKNRQELLRAGVHGQMQAGIHGDPSPNGGAYSICISEGYEDNSDTGEKIIYVGSGGQSSKGEQIRDQSFEDTPNKSLLISCETRRPVRVIRGPNSVSYYSPKKGYRYDGLYVVDKAEMRTGRKGFQMCFFELVRIREEDDGGPVPHRRLLTYNKLGKMFRGSKSK